MRHWNLRLQIALLSGLLASATLSIPAPEPSSTEPLSSAGARREIRVRILEPDTAPVVGRPGTLTARLDDPGYRVARVRFVVNGQDRTPLARGRGEPEPTFVLELTPTSASRVSVLVEAVDEGGAVLARALMWLTPSNPYREEVRVRSRPSWGDLVSSDANVHQHPIVTVHPFDPSSLTEDEKRFGMNRRPVRTVFLVDGPGFGDDRSALLHLLDEATDPSGGILRKVDETGILLLGPAPEVVRDFQDHELATLVTTEKRANGADPTDLAELLGDLMATAPDDRTVVVAIVTNGVRWGTYWKRKEIPGTSETEALVTKDEIQRIHALSYAREIPIQTLAVSTRDEPLQTDGRGHLSFVALEAKLFDPARRTALDPAIEAIAGKGAPNAIVARFDTYIHQMFDLLGILGASTEGGRAVRLAQLEGKDLRASLKEMLEPLVGKFQRRDFRVFETTSAAGCSQRGEEQILETARYRGGDKIIMGITLDESGSTQTESTARQIIKAARSIIGDLRPSEDCLLVSTFSVGSVPVVAECVDDPDEVERRVKARVQMKMATDIFGAAVSSGRTIVDMESRMRQEPGLLAAGQEVRKIVVLVTDGWQTYDTITPGEAAAYLRDHDVMLFEVIVPTDFPYGQNVAGWSSSVVGLNGTDRKMLYDPEDSTKGFAPFLESLYRGARESYRLGYTTTAQEKERRTVCIQIQGRSDLFIGREGGESYATGKSAADYLLSVARDSASPVTKRRQALAAVGSLGSDLDLRALVRIASGPESRLRVAAFLALVHLAARFDIDAKRVEKTLETLDDFSHLELVTTLAGPESPFSAEGSEVREETKPVYLALIEKVLVWELTRGPGAWGPDPVEGRSEVEGASAERPAGNGDAGVSTRPDPGPRGSGERVGRRPSAVADPIRLAALAALGRIDPPLTRDTIMALDRLVNDPDPAVREAAARLAHESTGVAPPSAP